MLLKWTLIVFGVASIALYVLSKLLAFMNPPRPGRPKAPLLRRVDRTLRWTVLVPFVVAAALLVLALWGTAPP